MQRKLQQLRSVTNSSAVIHSFFTLITIYMMHVNFSLLASKIQWRASLFFTSFWLILQVNKASIIVDATRYIEELKQKVDGLNSELGTAESSISQDELPMVHNVFIYPFTAKKSYWRALQGYSILFFSDYISWHLLNFFYISANVS